MKSVTLKNTTTFVIMTFLNLFLSELLEREIDKKFNDERMKIQKNDPSQDIKLTALNNKRKEDLEAIKAFK